MPVQSGFAIVQKGSVIAGSSTDNKEHITINTAAGANTTLSKVGISQFSPNNMQIKVNNDGFLEFRKDLQTVVSNSNFNRINNNLSFVVGGSVPLLVDGYSAWNDKFSKLAALKSAPDTINPNTCPVIPGADVAVTPAFYPKAKTANATNPAITKLQKDAASGKIKNDNAIPKVNLSKKIKPSLKLVKDFLKAQVNSKFCDVNKIKDKLSGAFKGNPSTQQLLTQTSPSTAGGDYPLNTEKFDAMPQAMADVQKELINLEKNLGEGGNVTISAARNIRIQCGAETNNNISANYDPVGRQVPAAVAVADIGATIAVAGAPKVQEIDNHSMFPCGSFTIEAGNGITMFTGAKGITMTSCGSISMATDTVFKLGFLQAVLGGEDFTLMGDKNVCIESGNTLSITCPTQIMLNSNVGVANNVICNGGGFFNGELYVTHITAPREIQETLVGFTKEGAYGFLRQGGKIVGKITVPGKGWSNEPFEITLDKQPDVVVELTPHAHEFPNIPLNLQAGGGDTSAQGAVRGAASILNFEVAAPAESILDGNKYPKSNLNPKSFIRNGSSTGVNLISQFGS